MTRSIALLGSTGSIGRQTLEVVRELGVAVAALTANSSVDLIERQAREFSPRLVALYDEAAARELKARLSDTGIEVLSGMDGLLAAATAEEADTVVTAVVGMIGLKPTLAAISKGKRIALANKETLVVAGEIVMRRAKEQGVSILPVDSEHCAFFQCLQGEKRETIEKLLLTCSGGPFFGMTYAQLERMTPGDALKHPNWSMGAKITIDSASMMNKGFEMIEAKWLYNVSQHDIEIVVHPQSIVHSMVEFKDGSVKAQLGLPDMRLPIRYALGLPGRLASDCKKMTVADYCNLTFELPDFEKFPLLNTAYEAADRGGNAACVVNAANEIAVAAFLNNQIKFTDIYKIIEQTLAWAPFVETPAYDDYVNSNAEARAYASSLIK